MNVIEEEKKFLLSYLQLDGKLQQEVKDRMKVVYALSNPSTTNDLFASDLVSQRFKDMYLQQLRKHNRRLETILKMDDVPLYEASEFEAILEDFIKNE
jgi:t-SNARE complex subunit (syntaxin)